MITPESAGRRVEDVRRPTQTVDEHDRRAVSLVDDPHPSRPKVTQLCTHTSPHPVRDRADWFDRDADLVTGMQESRR